MGQALRAHKGLGRTENPLCNLYCEEKVHFEMLFNVLNTRLGCGGRAGGRASGRAGACRGPRRGVALNASPGGFAVLAPA